jgi:putative ABC transport system substrate-binding protein
MSETCRVRPSCRRNPKKRSVASGLSPADTARGPTLGGVELQILEVSSAQAFGSAFSAMHTAGAGAFLVLADPFVLGRHHRDITALALQSRLPGIYPWRMYPEAGGLISYGPSIRALWQQTAT